MTRTTSALVFGLALLAAPIACSERGAGGRAEGGSAAAPTKAAPPRPADAGRPDSPLAVRSGSGKVSRPASRPAAGADFIADARYLYRLAACPADKPLVEGVSPRLLADHCKKLRRRYRWYSGRYKKRARAFLRSLQPKDLPSKVVYPFGGGDLLSVLTTYPDAEELTTLSLEHAGDITRVRRMSAAQRRSGLKLLRKTVHGLLALNDSTSVNMMKMQRGLIPGQLAFFLVALAVYDLEPVSLRYFRVERDGSLHYYTRGEIAKLRKARARRLSWGWVDTSWSRAFSNAELAFRARGATGAPRVHRHIAANLDDRHLAKRPGLLAHLEKKGRVAAMTKAAAYLLWKDQFSRIRDYLLQHMVYMVSDSTGIPPDIARARGFEQQTYGRYHGAFFKSCYRSATDLKFLALWRGQPYRPLRFRYGYLDRRYKQHLLITRRPAKR